MLDIVSNMKRDHENEIKGLKDRINFLENLLKAKNNKDYKKEIEKFNGSYIEMTTFGRNEINQYFDMTKEYAYCKEHDKYCNYISFVFK